MTESLNFEAFMRAYQNMVFTTAIRLLGSAAEAEDISQEVFLKAFDRFNEIGPSPTAGGWLKTVTRNLCLNHLERYRNRWRFFSEIQKSEESEESPTPELPDLSEPVNPAEANDQRHLLEMALQKLPDAQRVPLVLFHLENLSYEEISQKLKISLSKVKTDIFRARENLRKRMKVLRGPQGEWEIQEAGLGGAGATEREVKKSSRRTFGENRVLLSPDSL